MGKQESGDCMSKIVELCDEKSIRFGKYCGNLLH